MLPRVGAIRSIARVVEVSSKPTWTVRRWVAVTMIVSLTGFLAAFGDAVAAERSAGVAIAVGWVGTGWAIAKQETAVKTVAAVAEINLVMFMLFLLCGW